MKELVIAPYKETVLKSNIRSTLEPLHSFPVYSPKRPEDMGFYGRRDTENITPQEMLQGMLSEGTQFAGVDVIDLDEEKEMLIFSSSVKSPHTVWTVPYEDFDRSFRSNASELGFTLNEGVLIDGNESTAETKKPPQEVPLDLLTWMMIRNKKTNELRTTDLGDFRSENSGDADIDQFRLHLSDDKMIEIYETVLKRGKLATKTLVDLYNNVVRKHYPIPRDDEEEEEQYFLPSKTEQDILQGVANGYYRGDEVKGLKQTHYDGRGGGPMSNPTLHFRYTCHQPIETLTELNTLHGGIGIEYLVEEWLAKQRNVFGNTIKMVHTEPRPSEQETQGQVLKELFSVYTAEDILKVIDPYGTIVHDHLESWLEDELRGVFADQEVVVSGFRHHTNRYERTLRVNEGAEVVILPIKDEVERGKALSKSLLHLTDYVGKRLYPLWNDVNKYVVNKILMTEQERMTSLHYLKKDFNLPDNAIYAITTLIPTRAQLENLQLTYNEGSDGYIRISKALERYDLKAKRVRAEKDAIMKKIESGKAKYEDLIQIVYLEQRGQLFERTSTRNNKTMNNGYNIPGIPGNAITYEVDPEGAIHLKIGWLLSMKGLAEAWLGAVLKRLERKA